MRISSSFYFQTGVNTINKQESDLLHLFQQIGSGRRMLTPADDPLAAAQAITLSQSQSMNQRFADNREVALRALAETENVLGSMVDQMVAVKSRLIEAGNGTLSDQDRAVLAQVLSELRTSLLGSMNATDASGKYLFSGSKADTPAFTTLDGGYQYAGDVGQQARRSVQVDHTRVLDVGNTGSEVFMRAAPGTSAFVHGGGQHNQGQAVIGTMSIHDGALAQPVHALELLYEESADAGAGWRVVVRDSSGVLGERFFPAVEGGVQHIDLRANFGLSFSLTGAAEAGDQFSYQSVQQLNGTDELNVLNALSAAIEALNTPIKGDPVAQAQLQNSLNRALQVVDISYDNLLTTQATIGTRMNEIESLNDSGSLQSLQLAKELSRLEDVDYYTATSQLSLRKMALEAASMAFMKIQGTSLFSMSK